MRRDSEWYSGEVAKGGVYRFQEENKLLLSFLAESITTIAYAAVIYASASGGRNSQNNSQTGTRGSDSSLRRDITSSSELDSNMLNSLKNEGTIGAGGRSGGSRPLTGTPNSYGTTPGGHTLVYDANGRLIYDISPQRVKMTVWDQAPNGNSFPRDIKLDGSVPRGLLGN